MGFFATCVFLVNGQSKLNRVDVSQAVGRYRRLVAKREYCVKYAESSLCNNHLACYLFDSAGP